MKDGQVVASWRCTAKCFSASLPLLRLSLIPDQKDPPRISCVAE